MREIYMAEGVAFLEAPQQDSWLMNNGLLITGEETIMVDGRFGDAATLAFIRENRVNRYFISHFHIDHTSGAWRIAGETDCRPVLNEKEYQFLQSGGAMAQATGYGAAGVHALVETELMPRMGLRYIPGIGAYAPEEIEAISRGRLRVLPAPGHSPGHYCLYAPESESLFACDLGLDRFGPWYGFPHCDLNSFLASLEAARRLRVKQLFSSHRPVIRESIGQALDRCRIIIEKRHEQVLAAWRQGKRTVKEIAQEGIFYQKTDTFGKRMAPVMSFWQESMVRCHLDYAGLKAADAGA